MEQRSQQRPSKDGAGSPDDTPERDMIGVPKYYGDIGSWLQAARVNILALGNALQLLDQPVRYCDAAELRLL